MNNLAGVEYYTVQSNMKFRFCRDIKNWDFFVEK